MSNLPASPHRNEGSSEVLEKGGDQPLWQALQNNDPDALQEALARGADVNGHNEWGNPPLAWAVVHGKHQMVERLLSAGADVHATTAEAIPVLWLAALTNTDDSTMVDLLLDAGADPMPQNNDGPLRCATYKKNKRVLERLLSVGHPDDQAQSFEWTLLNNTHTPMAFWWIEHVPHLVKDVLPCGETPIGLAARKNNCLLIERLTTAGSNPNLRNRRQQLPLVRAVVNQRWTTVWCLWRNGADPFAEEGDHACAASVLKALPVEACIDGENPNHQAWLEHRLHQDLRIAWTMLERSSLVNGNLPNDSLMGLLPEPAEKRAEIGVAPVLAPSLTHRL